MSQKNKNIRLLIIWCTLLLVTVGFFVIDGSSASSNVPKEHFRIADFSSVAFVELESAKQKNILKNTGDTWQLNDKYQVDQGMKDVFFGLMDRLRVQRVYEGKSAKELITQMKDTAVSVQIRFSDGNNRNFYVAGDFNELKSYFIEGDKLYQIHIPGYQSYVAGMFSVPEIDWRNRLIFDSHWQSVEYIKLDYPMDVAASFKLKYQKGDFVVEDFSDKQDTVKVMQYIEANCYQYADKFLSTDDVKGLDFDETEAIDFELKVFDQVDIFKMTVLGFWEEKNMYLAKKPSGEYFLISPRRAASILKSRDDLLMK